MPDHKWGIYFFKIFDQQYRLLVQEVVELRENRPKIYKKHPKTKLLKSLRDAIFRDVPDNPLHPKFNLGDTLGPNYKQFKRVKNGLPSRYRLFFQFSSLPGTIIYIWVNDGDSLRKEGSKRDVYYVFRGMIKNGTIPEKYNELLNFSKICDYPAN